MEPLLDDPILQWFLTMAYMPWKVYLACVVLLLLSSFGLPVPEEVTLLSAGFMAYVGRTPEQFPPPADGSVVDAWLLAGICTAAVFLSDILIYGIGRRLGPSVRESRLGRLVPLKTWVRAEDWTERHGGKVCWVFRFMPGIRFPGHLTCGVVKLPFWQFCLADGLATLVSVPTQILLIAYHGDVVVSLLRRFKIGFVTILIVLAVGLIGVHLLRRRSRSTEPAESDEPTEPDEP